MKNNNNIFYKYNFKKQRYENYLYYKYLKTYLFYI